MALAPVGASVSRGLIAVGSSPPLLGFTFLSLLCLWALVSAVGGPDFASPRALVLVQSLPLVNSFVDLPLVLSGTLGSAAVAIAFGVVLILVRAAIMSVLITLILESLRGERGWRGAFRAVGRRAVRSYPAMVGFQSLFVAVSLAATILSEPFLASSLGSFVIVILLGVALYFLILGPVVAVSEGLGLRAAVQRSVRVARMPGSQQGLVVGAYLAITVIVVLFSPTSRVSLATPTVQIWAYGLFVTFLHVGYLAAFVYRWLLLKDLVPEPTPREARPRGLLGRR